MAACTRDHPDRLAWPHIRVLGASERRAAHGHPYREAWARKHTHLAKRRGGGGRRSRQVLPLFFFLFFFARPWARRCRSHPPPRPGLVHCGGTRGPGRWHRAPTDARARTRPRHSHTHTHTSAFVRAASKKNETPRRSAMTQRALPPSPCSSPPPPLRSATPTTSTCPPWMCSTTSACSTRPGRTRRPCRSRCTERRER